MTSTPSLRSLVRCGLAASLLVAAAACGKKGPPLAPLIRQPLRVEELKARRLGDELHLQFKIPGANTDGSTPADLDRIEAYAIDGEVADERGRPLSNEQFVRRGTLVGQVAVEPPPVEEVEGEEGEAATEAPRPEPVDDPRPAQGELASIVDRALAPRPPIAVRKAAPDEPPFFPLSPFVGTPPPPVDETPRRTYGIVGVSTRNRRGPIARTSVPLGRVPPAVAMPAITYSAREIRVSWTPPDGARLPVQPTVDATRLAAKPLAVVAGTPTRYNVYEAPREGAAPPTVPVPKHAEPLREPVYGEPFAEFGVERCYVVRAVTVLSNVTLESAPSPVACVTPEDTFAPAAPANLAAVAGEGAISLIWEPSPDADVAGYLVLRGADGGPLEALTPAPIRETTYRDAAVTAGVRYVYAVVAVDASPRANRSGESNRVEETAR